MKPANNKLGHHIQQLLLSHRYSMEQLARDLGITADGLSNLIHGRRRFKDDTLSKLSASPLMKQAGVSLSRLRAYRALDDYALDELVLALAEGVRLGMIASLDATFFPRLQTELSQAAFQNISTEKRHALIALLQADPG